MIYLAMKMTDGREDYPVAGFEVAGAGVYLPAPELAVDGAVWSAVWGVAEGVWSWAC